jgi:hypothetical protein
VTARSTSGTMTAIRRPRCRPSGSGAAVDRLNTRSSRSRRGCELRGPRGLLGIRCSKKRHSIQKTSAIFFYITIYFLSYIFFFSFSLSILKKYINTTQEMVN